MANKMEAIPIGKIRGNSLNDRSMNQDEIKTVKDSILKHGFLRPFVVYLDEGTGNYILVSGHKTFEAYKSVLGNNPRAQANCIVIDKPKDEFEEREIMAALNTHRSTPEDIAKECKILSENYDRMPRAEKEAFIEKAKQEFVESVSGLAEYNADPAKYLNNRFRPRLTYIRSVSGLGLSNKTIQNYLKMDLKEHGEDLNEDPAEPAPGNTVVAAATKKAKVISEQMLIKRMNILEGLITTYLTDSPAPEHPGIWDDLKDKIISTRSFVDP